MVTFVTSLICAKGLFVHNMFTVLSQYNLAVRVQVLTLLSDAEAIEEAKEGERKKAEE